MRSFATMFALESFWEGKLCLSRATMIEQHCSEQSRAQSLMEIPIELASVLYSFKIWQFSGEYVLAMSSLPTSSSITQYFMREVYRPV